MIKFKNLKTGEIKTAFAVREDGEKTYIKFSQVENNTASKYSKISGAVSRSGYS